MEGYRQKAHQRDGRCLRCFALQGEPTRVQPHERLRMTGSAALLTGTREEFICDDCGQIMVRFLATQTHPLPSDRWRFESSKTPSIGGSSDARLDDRTVQPAPTHEDPDPLVDLDRSNEAFDEPGDEAPALLPISCVESIAHQPL